MFPRQNSPICDIVIPVWNGLEYTRKCVEKIIANTEINFRLIIVDNGSDIETKTYLENLCQKDNLNFTLIRNEENLGFVKASNQGLHASRSPYVCLLNNDAFVTKNWLKRMIALANKNPQFGIVNPTWMADEPDNLEEQLEVLDRCRGQYLEVNDCMGFCMLIKREVIEKIGLLDEIFGLGGLEDSDYCKRAVFAGFRCLRAKDALVIHQENTTLNRIKDWREKRKVNEEIFYQRWPRRRQIVFILDELEFNEEKQLVERLKFLLSLARLGVRVHIWIILDPKSAILDKEYLSAKRINEHNNIKYFYFYYPPFNFLKSFYKGLFILVCFLKLLSRQKKRVVNRFKAVFLNRSNYIFFQVLKAIHQVDIFTDTEPETCTIIQRELEWIRVNNA